MTCFKRDLEVNILDNSRPDNQAFVNEPEHPSAWVCFHVDSVMWCSPRPWVGLSLTGDQPPALVQDPPLFQCRNPAQDMPFRSRLRGPLVTPHLLLKQKVHVCTMENNDCESPAILSLNGNMNFPRPWIL